MTRPLTIFNGPLWSQRAAATPRRQISPCKRLLPGHAIPTTRTYQRMARGSSKPSTATKPVLRARARAIAQRRARRVRAGAPAPAHRLAPPPECRFLLPANPPAIRNARVLPMAERVTAKAGSFWRDEEGSALVEATIVMPLLLSLFLGVFEFSWFFYNQQLVVSGLRDAARYMTRIELTDGNRDPCAQKDQYGALYTD